MTIKLLLIEDSFTTQQLVQNAFARADTDVSTTTTLAEALREMQAVIPDVIVADASLPEVDGFQLCHMIRDNEALRHVPVILLTSGLALYDQAQGEQAGVSGHLAKPFEAPALRRLVEHVVATPPVTEALSAAESRPTPVATPWHTDAAARSAQPQGTAETHTASPPQDRQDLEELAALIAPWTPGESARSAAINTPETAALGRLLLQVIQETIQTQLSSLIEQLTPRILAAMQEVVTTKTPELLEALLQREIDQLKQAVDTDDHDGD